MTVTHLTLRRPDDWHLHLRDAAMLAAVIADTARHFARAIVMPNLVPPVRTKADATAYQSRIEAVIPAGSGFTPLMTLYLTEVSDPTDIVDAFTSGAAAAVKLYPAGATTNSDNGVADMAAVRGVFAAMEKAGMPLLIHGEVTDPDVDIFDREAVFIDRHFAPLLRDHPALRVVLEHVTTQHAVDFVSQAGANVAATITPHHLTINRTALFAGGIRPHYYCLPIAKREEHRVALRDAATSGEASFFLGTDTAPHSVITKEAECGCAGIFSAPAALEIYAQVFDEEDALDNLEKFASLNGAAFYRLKPNQGRVTLVSERWTVPAEINLGNSETVKPFLANETLNWKLKKLG